MFHNWRSANLKHYGIDLNNMIEEVLFGSITMPGELIRVVLAFLGVGVATYYDLFNNKNVPDRFLYGFLALAFLVNLFFYQETLFLFSIIVALFFSVMGYIFYRVGQIGGADVFMLASIMLLLPIAPSFTDMPFNMPFIIPVLIFAGVIFAVYVMAKFGLELHKRENVKPKLIYLLMFVPYILFAYVYATSILFSVVYFLILTVLFIATVFFMMYKEELTMLLAEKVSVERLEPEDVIAMELMDPQTVKEYGISRVATKELIEQLRKKNFGNIWIYSRLPQFLPFMLIGMLLALFFSKYLLFG
jgi:Flp pilus assembly protein protease CpaA